MSNDYCWFCRNHPEHKPEREERERLLAEVEAFKPIAARVMIQTCAQCRQEYPQWSELSFMTCPDCKRKELEKKIDLWKRYRKFLREELDSAIGVAEIHGWRSTPERIEEGRKLRVELGIEEAEDQSDRTSDESGFPTMAQIRIHRAVREFSGACQVHGITDCRTCETTKGEGKP